MKNHKYQITTHWDSKFSGVTSDYTSYSRNHKISSVGKPEISASSDPMFRGDQSKYNPEELFLASISSCHMLWYLHLCSNNKIKVIDYLDHATGTMVEENSGCGRFSEVILNPKVIINGSDNNELALKLHHEANKNCFIANSCNFPIVHKPKIKLV